MIAHRDSSPARITITAVPSPIPPSPVPVVHVFLAFLAFLLVTSSYTVLPSASIAITAPRLHPHTRLPAPSSTNAEAHIHPPPPAACMGEHRTPNIPSAAGSAGSRVSGLGSRISQKRAIQRVPRPSVRYVVSCALWMSDAAALPFPRRRLNANSIRRPVPVRARAPSVPSGVGVVTSDE
ncbi:hypothetical protein PLEOSDRAFT_1109680 [Pleurotus ostreatus PC15]|uniref:Uncharacterized protein n=1 Tax=Pleurotus ostreatus (strain PC15) TaxID=1137138 RepID=A0A067N3H9_PLEO1|nr:hypothetical protein PLEOSDRAFT_1109680 [Pleurotus ostreatus PC15]